MTASTPTIQSAGDLRARICAISIAEPDPSRITDHILRNLTAPEFHVVATVCLRLYVQRVLQTGVGAQTAVPESNSAVPDAASYKTPTGTTPSAKVGAIRDWVERELLKSICVDEQARAWRHIGDCTADELESAASNRRRHAALTVAEAEHLEGIAKAVEHAGVDKVRELPRETLEAVLRR